MYRKILSEPLHFPGPEVVPPSAKDLLVHLLDRRPERRLGANGAAEIKAHAFFASIDWRKLLERKYEPTFKPNVVRKPSALFFSFLLLSSSMGWRVLIWYAGRRPRHGQLRPRVHVRGAHRLVRRRPDAVADHAAAVHGLVVQPSGSRARRRGWQRQGSGVWQRDGLREVRTKRRRCFERARQAPPASVRKGEAFLHVSRTGTL